MTMRIPVRISYTRSTIPDRYRNTFIIYISHFPVNLLSYSYQRNTDSKKAPDLLLTHHTQTLKGGIVMKKLAMIREFIEEYYKELFRFLPWIISRGEYEVRNEYN